MLPQLDGFLDRMRLKYRTVRRILPFDMRKIGQTISTELEQIGNEIAYEVDIESYLKQYLERTTRVEQFIVFIGKIKHVDWKETASHITSLQQTIDYKERLLARIKTLYSQEITIVIREKGVSNPVWQPEFVKEHITTRPDIRKLDTNLKAAIEDLNKALDGESHAAKSAMKEANGQFPTQQIIFEELNNVVSWLGKEREAITRLVQIEKYIHDSLLPLRGQMETLHQGFVELKAFTNSFEAASKKVEDKMKSFGRNLNEVGTRCGFPLRGYYSTIQANLSDADEEIAKLLALVRQRPDFVARIVAMNEAVLKYEGLSSAIAEWRKSYAELEQLTNDFRALSTDPVGNRNRIIATWKAIKADAFEQFTTQIPFFNTMKLQPTGTVYHGIGISTGEMIEGHRELKDLREYAEAIIKRLRNGIIPTTSERNYNSCRELPAVYCWPFIGNWSAFAYFELSCATYPVFRSPHSTERFDEYMIYTQGALPLVDATLILCPVSYGIRDDKKEYVRESAVDAIIKELHRQLGRMNDIRFKISGNSKNWTTSEYISSASNSL
jgi:hypothetical protein